MEESYDHIIRNPQQLQQVEQYIIKNPEQARISVTQASSLIPRTMPRQDAWTTEDRLRHLFAYNNEKHQFSPAEVEQLIAAIDRAKILDPACGSGAFPMGILHKLVFILAKLDPGNERWKTLQLQKVDSAIASASQIDIPQAREAALNELENQRAAIEESFNRNELDYGRKLYLIENCIYGVDIQPIAVQIAKLRFFISLIVDQQVDDRRPNRGVIPLPNLETRIVAANTLLAIERPLGSKAKKPEPTLSAPKLSAQVKAKAEELKDVLRQYIKVQNVERKQRWLEEGRAVCNEMNELLQSYPTVPPLNADWIFPTASGPETIDALLPGLDDKPQLAAQTFRNDKIEVVEKALADVRNRHFEARTPKTKEKYRKQDAELRQKLIALLQQDGWPADQANRLATWNPYDQNAHADFFDPEWMFSLGDGFDLVIGNPPYVRQEQIKEFKPLFQKQYSCYTGTADLYVYFFERAIQLLREAGVLSYICSNKYFRAGYGEKLRGFLTSQTTLQQLIDFGDAPVFTAIAYPSIIVASKTPAKAHQVRMLNWEMGPPIAEFAEIFEQNSGTIEQSKLDSKGWQLERPEVLRLLAKLRKAGKPLGEYVNGNIYMGIKTGLNEAFVVDRATKERLIAEHASSAEILKPFLRGRDVKRWRTEFAEQYLIKIESSENRTHPWSEKNEITAESIFKQTYPAIHHHFQQFRNGLITRTDQGKYFWELRSCVYWSHFSMTKIIYPDIYEHQSFAIDNIGLFSGNTSYFIPTADIWLCGLFNSQTVEWFYSNVSNKVRGGYLRAFTDYMKQIPIPVTTSVERIHIEEILDRILTFKRADPHADVSALEAKIDRLVYQLYGLTEAEIALVEGRSAKA